MRVSLARQHLIYFDRIGGRSPSETKKLKIGIQASSTSQRAFPYEIIVFDSAKDKKKNLVCDFEVAHLNEFR